MRYFLSLFLTFLFLNSCSLEESSKKQDSDLLAITKLAEEINTLVESSICNDETECAFIAFGKKPCGGPWGYLVYSNSIDTVLLINKVELFNQMQNSYNLRYNIISDCSMILEPDGLICEGGKCKAVYN